MFKEVTPEEADKLAEAGLLWYDCVHVVGVHSWVSTAGSQFGILPSKLFSNNLDLGYKFFILTEE